MSLLGGSKEKSPESPEEIVESEEITIVQDMESLQKEIENAIKAETNLFDAIERGLPENTIDERLGSIEIYLEKDIEPEDKNIRTEFKKLKEHERQLKTSKPLREKHQELLNNIQDALKKAEEEIERLEEVVEISKNVLRGQDFDHKEMMQKVEEKITRDTQEAGVIEEELRRAEEIEEELNQS